MSHAARVLLALMLSLPTAAIARGSCSENWVCVETVERQDGVDIYARNLKPWPLTITLSSRTWNLDRDGPRSVTRTLEGGDRALIARMRSRDPDDRYDYRYWYDWTVGRLDPEHQDNYLYRLPYGAGRSYRVLQGFGSRFSHTGLEQYAVDFYMAVGTPVHAARGGVVVRVTEEHDIGCWEDGCGRYANFVVILHDDGTTGEYYHLMHEGVLVDVGDRVHRGEHIAFSGNTGHTTVPHLHFAVYRADEWGSTQSLPFRFVSRDGVVSAPRPGRRYLAD